MAKITRLFKTFLKLLLPIVLLLLIAIAAGSIWLVHLASRPTSGPYLVLPEKYGQLSARGAQVTDEKWTNRDGTPARGWLLRGNPGSPAVMLFHKYGADRSHVLNLGVKLNEATSFTVLMPDGRGHSQEPTTRSTSFGGCETDDAASAVEFVRGLKAPDGQPLAGKDIGFYGIEMGALAALGVASRDESAKVILLDSLPADSDALLASIIAKRYPFASGVTSKFSQLGTYAYYYDGCYRRVASCDLARTAANRSVLLLAGLDAPAFQDSTSKAGKCFPASTKTEVNPDLSPSGYSIMNASIEQSSAYDQRVIDFFRMNLGAGEVVSGEQ